MPDEPDSSDRAEQIQAAEPAAKAAAPRWPLYGLGVGVVLTLVWISALAYAAAEVVDWLIDWP